MNREDRPSIMDNIPEEENSDWNRFWRNPNPKEAHT